MVLDPRRSRQHRDPDLRRDSEDGVSAKQFALDLRKHTNAKVLTIRINSPGGSCFDAIAILNTPARHSAHKTVWVDGLAASAASVVAMAGNEIIMPANTTMMVHEPYGAAIGTAADMRAIAEALDRVEASTYNRRLLGEHGHRRRVLFALCVWDQAGNEIGGGPS